MREKSRIAKANELKKEMPNVDIRACRALASERLNIQDVIELASNNRLKSVPLLGPKYISQIEKSLEGKIEQLSNKERRRIIGTISRFFDTRSNARILSDNDLQDIMNILNRRLGG